MHCFWTMLPDPTGKTTVVITVIWSLFAALVTGLPRELFDIISRGIQLIIQSMNKHIFLIWNDPFPSNV